MTTNTTSLEFLMDAWLPSNGSQMHGGGVVSGNLSGHVMLAAVAAAEKRSVERLLRLFDTLILSIVCVGLVGNTLALSALSSRGCRGRRRRWRTHHALAILLQVDDFLRAGQSTQTASYETLFTMSPILKKS